MHIAIFTDYSFPSIGGIQSAIAHQKRALEAHGHTVTIVTVDYAELRNKPGYILLPSPVRLKQGAVTNRGFVPFPSIEEWVMRQLKSSGVDVIHVETEFTVGGLGVRVAKRLRLPWVYTVHTLLWRQAETVSIEQLRLFSFLTDLGVATYLPGRGRKIPRLPQESSVHFTFRKLVLQFAHRATVVVTPSQHLRDTLRDWGVERPIVQAVNFIGTLPLSKPVLPAVPVFLWTGRLDPEKRPLDFVEALERLEALVPEGSFRVMMVGAGEKLPEIRERIGAKPYMLHLGPVAYEDMPSYFARASVLVMTSLDFDNQPMVITEAVMHGRGAVLVDTQLQEGLQNGAGVWAKQPTTEALAQALRCLIESPEQLESMSEAAWNNRLEFSPNEGVKRLEAIYQQALALHTAKSKKRKIA